MKNFFQRKTDAAELDRPRDDEWQFGVEHNGEKLGAGLLVHLLGDLLLLLLLLVALLPPLAPALLPHLLLILLYILPKEKEVHSDNCVISSLSKNIYFYIPLKNHFARENIVVWPVSSHHLVDNVVFATLPFFRDSRHLRDVSSCFTPRKEISSYQMRSPSVLHGSLIWYDLYVSRWWRNRMVNDPKTTNWMNWAKQKRSQWLRQRSLINQPQTSSHIISWRRRNFS